MDIGFEYPVQGLPKEEREANERSEKAEALRVKFNELSEKIMATKESTEKTQLR